MSDELELLLKDIRACQICKNDLPLGVRPILQAHEKSKILIAGQAPGARVHESGTPWDDPSGERLRDWLALDKETFYDPEKIALVPMGFCYPGTGKSGDLPPRPECAQTWHQTLLNQLPDIQLSLVIGKYAQNYYLKGTQKKNLTEAVKSWEEYSADNILPLPHPSPRNNIWLKKNPWFEQDVLPTLKEKVQDILN